jgi:hypothetical protein
MPAVINEREEQELFDAVKKASDLVTGGLSPDEAVEKVARDGGFGPGKIRTIGQAYNNGAQLSQWRQPNSTSILDKLASFPLCDPEKVVDNIYNGPTPAEKAAAVTVDADYSRPPSWYGATEGRTKFASATLPRNPPPAYAPDPLAAVHKVYDDVQRTKQAADETRRQASAAEDVVRAKVAGLTTYLKQASYNRLPLAVIEEAAVTYFGEPARTLVKMAASAAKSREKMSSALGTVIAKPIDLNAEPFTLIKAAVDAGKRCVALKKQAADLAAAATTKKTEGLRPFSKAGDAEQPANTGPWMKEAADLFAKTAIFNSPAFGAAVGSGLATSLGISKSKGEMVDDEWMKLEDPEHENELRKIKAHAMINQLMTDPDDPISGHDPDRVLAAYNEIASATPRLADNVAVLRPQLRKRLEGNAEPFETKEMLDIEKGLAQTKLPTPSTSILSEGPEKMMG